MAALAVTLVVAGCSGEEVEELAPSHYLSLGDSLTVGVQPDESGRGQETSEGYTDVLYRSLKDDDSTLQHERMGCGGEDTTTFVGGGIPGCDDRYEAGSQLDEAEEFLREHGDAVDLVTLTIGGNNFTDCVDVAHGDNSPGSGLSVGDIGVDEDCVANGLEGLESEMPVIAERLTEAADSNTQIIAMTYYNPFLALALLEEPGNTSQSARSVEIIDQVNASLTASYEAAGIDVADVDTVFDGSDTDVPSGSDTGMPVNLQQICDLTWMCDAARGPDIHTNLAGAQAIAEVFEDQIR